MLCAKFRLSYPCGFREKVENAKIRLTDGRTYMYIYTTDGIRAAWYTDRSFPCKPAYKNICTIIYGPADLCTS